MHIDFYDDLNLLQIQSDITSALGKYIDQKDAYLRECKKLRKIYTCSHNPADRLKALTILREMEKLLPMVENGTLTQVYQRKVNPYIVEYQKLCSESRVFGMDKCTNIPMRVGIIIKFLNVTKEFINITWSTSYNMSKICPICYSTMKKCSTIMMCTCGYSYAITRTLGIQVNSSRVRIESSYDATKNFKKEYMHLCGAINDLKKDQRSDIESYIYRTCIKNPTRENIRDAFTYCGYNNYHDVNYMYHLVTGEPLPPIIQYLDICMSRFAKYSSVFSRLTDKEGKNITNIHFLTKLFLWQENIPYRDDWFRSLADQTEAKHIRNIKKVCNILKVQDSSIRWDYPSQWDAR